MTDVLDALAALLDQTEVAPFLAYKDEAEGLEQFAERAERCPACLPHSVRFWRLAVGGCSRSPETWLTADQAAYRLPDKSLSLWPAMPLAVADA